jgi:hypothetical protein
MLESRFVRRTPFLVAVGAVVFSAGTAVGLFWPRESERETVASAVSPNGSLTAVVFRIGEEKFLLGVRGKDGTTLVAEPALVVPRGYHEQLVSLEWTKNSNSVKVVVDRDFGEGNRVYVLDIKNVGLHRE